jgi:hypothetical protein
MKKFLTATLKNGKKINCEFKINKYGCFRPQYPIEYKKVGWCIQLSKKQVAALTGIKVTHDRNFIKLDRQYKYNEYDKMINDLQGIKEPTLEELLKENPTLDLWKASNSGGNTIIDLPKAFKEKKRLILKAIDWDCNSDWKFTKKITAQELNALILKTEAEEEKKRQIENKKIKKLQKTAQKTGKPQKYFTYSEECNTPDIGCDIDNIIVYVNPDGSQFKECHHCY